MSERSIGTRVVKIDSVESWKVATTMAENHGLLVVVHFSAYWSWPSVSMNSCFERVASTYPNVTFLMVDIDEVRSVASRMKITQTPTFVVMKKGYVISKFVGANPLVFRERISKIVQTELVYVHSCSLVQQNISM